MEHLRTSSAERVGKYVMNDKTVLRRDGLSRTYDSRLSSEVAEAIASLPPLEREVLIFSEYEGLRLDEIAAIVDVDSETVAVKLERARERLRRLFSL